MPFKDLLDVKFTQSKSYKKKSKKSVQKSEEDQVIEIEENSPKKKNHIPILSRVKLVFKNQLKAGVHQVTRSYVLAQKIRDLFIR